MSGGTVGTVLDGLLAVAAVALAVSSLLARARFPAVGLFIGFGVVVGLIYARLAAPDLAMAEVAIGAAATGALLLRTVSATSGVATTRASPRSPGRSGARRVAAVVAGAVASAAVLGVALAAVLSVPPRTRLPALVMERVPDSGVDHPVTAVLLAFRAFDTLLEVVVVLVAAVACLALAPTPQTGLAPAPPAAVAPLSFLVRAAVPAGIVVAGWVLYIGTYAPGGAFHGGAVLGGLLLLLVLTGRQPPALGPRALPSGLVLGAAVFLAVAIVGLLVGEALLDYGHLATIAIVTIESSIALSVGLTLAAFYLALVPDPHGALR
ncbi:DUF4040 domain-containing protein [Blastococcus sp. PRF04-17]|uniref:DUF4040 domain-containing protein n=1 Tax=Blastococcus sp. PRF04-17 TaxID=2933797 RepID=UPI001FF49322|nr:DUF4040 domain-containing protein [Blastococcus sp. PRF04-17]UOX99970.1 DUF4040 domain-containing protein [Blastococcus sp. PRF04-17]